MGISPMILTETLANFKGKRLARVCSSLPLMLLSPSRSFETVLETVMKVQVVVTSRRIRHRLATVFKAGTHGSALQQCKAGLDWAMTRFDVSHFPVYFLTTLTTFPVGRISPSRFRTPVRSVQKTRRSLDRPGPQISPSSKARDLRLRKARPTRWMLRRHESKTPRGDRWVDQERR